MKTTYLLLIILGSFFDRRCLATPGAINRDNYFEEVQSLQKDVLEKVKSSVELSPEIVGHRVGFYERYPKHISHKTDVSKYAKMTDLMEESFDVMKLHGIEIDAQTYLHEDLQEKTFIVHDKIGKKLKKEQIDYLKENSFPDFLRHFIAKGYHLQGKKIFIELKAEDKWYHKHPSLDDYDRNLVDTLFADIMKVASEIVQEDEREIFLQQIAYVSFNFYSLERMQKLLKFMKVTNSQFFLILTTDISYMKLWAKITRVIVFNDYLKEKIITSEWLTGLWYDPYYLSTPAHTFARLSALRQTPLKIYVNTYLSKRENLYKLLDDQHKKKGLKNVQGIIIDTH